MASTISKDKNILNGMSHHAYLLVGATVERDRIISILENEYKIVIHGNPDFFARDYVTFSIDDARELKSMALSRPVANENRKDAGAGKKFFILKINGITVEAQNALLKLLEEPADYAHFFLIIPSAHLLLPTVRSRMLEIGESGKKKGVSESQDNREIIAEVEEFLKVGHAKRLDIVKKLVDEISKEKKTKQDAIDFLNVIERVVYKKNDVKRDRKILKAIDTARNYLNDRAPSVKMLLEYVALNI